MMTWSYHGPYDLKHEFVGVPRGFFTSFGVNQILVIFVASNPCTLSHLIYLHLHDFT